jgi:hypothetical protein
MTDQSDHVVLPRAAVDEFRAWAKLQQSVPWADAYSAMMLKRIDDLFAAAKPVVDAGVYRVLRRGPFVIRIPVERAGDHRVLLIAADAAGEE